MSLYLASLNSGSNANCYYVGNKQDAVLVDTGLSCRETELRMKRMGLDMQNIRAIFISHEHSDHVAGLYVIAKKYKLPVFITGTTLKNCPGKIDRSQVRHFSEDHPVTISTLTITAFRKSHDAADPHSFIVESGGITAGIMTDIGYACKRVKKYFKRCDGIFLESNYCEQLLADGPYSVSLKKRIHGRKGHLSNKQALELFLTHRSEKLRLLILSHLSQNNNDPSIVEKTFKPYADELNIVIASRYRESELFSIKESLKTGGETSKTSQLSLFN